MLKIIISPAKKMNVIEEDPCRLTVPAFPERTRRLFEALRAQSMEELQNLWKCSEKLAAQNYERLHTYEFDRNLSPALLAYEGIQYQYMAPQIFTDTQWTYVEQHLRILSGFYGILRPTDGVIPYRLEMQAKIGSLGGKRKEDSAVSEGKEKNEERNTEPNSFPRTLYAYWGEALYQNLLQDFGSRDSTFYIVNLASAEYSKAVLPYLSAPVRQVTCIFGEQSSGKIKVKGTQAKMARGEMVRWMAENQVEDVRELQGFDRLNYCFRRELSSEEEYVFLKM